MAGFHVELKTSGFAQFDASLADAGKKLDLAAARALRKTAQWLRSSSSREISQELRISKSPLGHRYKVFARGTAREVKLWVGLEPIAVHYLGQPKQNATGVSVGHRQYDDAFISPMKSSQKLVFVRKGRERLPIKLVREDWEGPAMNALEKWEKRAQNRFLELFEQEARHVFSAA